MKIISVKLPERYIEYIDELADKESGLFDSRSDVVRAAVREYLRKRGYRVE